MGIKIVTYFMAFTTTRAVMNLPGREVCLSPMQHEEATEAYISPRITVEELQNMVAFWGQQVSMPTTYLEVMPDIKLCVWSLYDVTGSLNWNWVLWSDVTKIEQIFLLTNS